MGNKGTKGAGSGSGSSSSSNQPTTTMTTTTTARTTQKKKAPSPRRKAPRKRPLATLSPNDGGGELTYEQHRDLLAQWDEMIAILNRRRQQYGLTLVEKERLRMAMGNRDNIQQQLQENWSGGRARRHASLTSKIPSIRIQEGNMVYDITMDLVGVGARGDPTTVGTEMERIGREDPLAAVTEVICMTGHGSFGALTVETSSGKGEEVSRFTLTIDDQTPRGLRSSEGMPQNVGVVVSYEGGPGQSAFFELPKRSFLIKTTPYGSCGKFNRERDTQLTLAASQEMAQTIPRLFSRDGTDVFSTGLTEEQVQLESGGQRLNLGRGSMAGSRLPSNNSIPGDYVLNLEIEFFEGGRSWAWFGLYGGKRLMVKAEQQSRIQAAVDAQHREIGTSRYNIAQGGNDRPREEFIKWFILKCVYKVRGAFYNSSTGQQFAPTEEKDAQYAGVTSTEGGSKRVRSPSGPGWERGPRIISENWPPEPEDEEGKRAWIDKLLMPMVITYNQQGQESRWDPLLHRFYGGVWESVRGLLLDGGTGLERGEVLLSELMSWYAAGTQTGFAVWVPNICYPFDYTAKIGNKTYDVGQDDGAPVFLEGHEQLVNAVFEAFKVKLGALDEGNQAGFNMLLDQLGRREMSGLAPRRSQQRASLVEAGADTDEDDPLLMAGRKDQGGGRRMRRRRRKITRHKRSRGRTRKKKRRRVPRKRGRRKRTKRGRRKRRQKTRRHR